MNCRRAVEILTSLANPAVPLAFAADEIEEIMGNGLAVEADPDVCARVERLAPVVRELTGAELDDPAILDKIAPSLAELDAKLKSDWHRFTTSDAKLAALELQRATLRRAVALLRDPVERVPLVGLVIAGRNVVPGAIYRPCPALGDELYAITRRGGDVLHQLQLRLARYANAPLEAFMKKYEKVATKMRAMASDVATLSANIGYVRKNPHQVVIGLVKAGDKAEKALQIYHRSLREVGAADVAVTCARNATAFGGTTEVAHRLHRAERLMLQAGFWPQQVVAGAAKTLLPFEPMSVGIDRLRDLVHQLESFKIPQGAYALKLAARLMPAHGQPFDIVQRVVAAMNQLRASEAQAPAPTFLPPVAVALASMAKTDAEIPPLVQRFRAVQHGLVAAKLSWAQNAADHALECVASAGTPQEVVGTVHRLTAEISRGTPPDQAQVAIAASFAKRFAF